MSRANNPWIDLLMAQGVGDYRLISCVGTGGFGFVFGAEHTDSGARFAVKVLDPQVGTEHVVDFENEGVLLSLLTACDGVINYVESGSDSVELTANGINVSVPIRFHVLALASGSVNELVEDPGARADMARGDVAAEGTRGGSLSSGHVPSLARLLPSGKPWP
ncbi:hypothetical protein [Microbacterium imperiale]|uniref:hypothetical protein n=1 Tax=Microbacterium imperiale TaxID=33884 RepID=UPI001AE9B5C2|nr:hypothetical protein [Microbacterium imperiale]MBP2422081.1 hypothetical protein [Microbacterium imperiale]MDS0200241.1 hypothetical protein [Microbacterium imperiale]